MKAPTLQQFFDRALEGMRAQGRPSYDRDRQACFYRGPDDTKCAIGFSIPDERYTPKLEGKSPHHSLLRAILFSGGADALSGALDDLQNCHDGAAATQPTTDDFFMQDFERRMGDFARKYDLIYAPVTS